MSTSKSSGAPPRLLDVPAAAAYLTVPERTIREWVFRRQIRYHKVGRSLRFAREDLDAMVRVEEPAGGRP